ncbi:hypothetical protein POVCU1_022180 [Plasmodium ovale curtisi]|uniref:Uncharacterized protein n=1 Tax=Plasmodium ovale curtisi TaxID=864141 RepID=A0A1A8WGW0_PLAOA|nr:hypothetical protein POVCU1_022180 [Plasmodium ovale curtisi]
MEEKLLQPDVLEEYKKIHKKHYEERILKENEINEKLKNEELASEIYKNEQAYRQLQVEKDREYSLQYYHEINNLQRPNAVSTTDNSDILNNYTERLIITPNYSYTQNETTRSLLDNNVNVPFSQRIGNFFLRNNIGQYFGCSTLQLICNITLFILKKEYIPVSAVLKRDALDMYKYNAEETHTCTFTLHARVLGSKLFYSINLAEVIPPLEIFSTSPECLTVNIINKDSIVLWSEKKMTHGMDQPHPIPLICPKRAIYKCINICMYIYVCNTEECINNWWVFLTKQILCLNQGEMRDETDDNTVEDRQYNIINNDNFDGVSVDIQDRLEDIPNG